MPFDRGPVLSYRGAGIYATVGVTEYVGEDDVLHIPHDFPTDLATVPRVLWTLIPPTGAYEKAAVLHDWLCVQLALAARTGRRPPVTARDTDGLFRRVMREAGVGFVTRWLMWVGVRWGALVNPARRAGWWRDAPLVLTVSGVVLALAVGGLLAVHRTVDVLLRLFS